MTFEDLKAALRTVVAIPVTAFTESGAIDETATVAVLEHMLDGGITALTPNGNTGEFYSLTLAEADAAMKLMVSAIGERAVAMPGVGHSLADAVAMAANAYGAGAPVVMVHQPTHPYKSIDGWVEYHCAIAREVPDLALVPYIRDPLLTADAIRALVDACPNVVAVKYAVPDAFALPACVARVGADRITWIAGLAEGWAPFHWLGGARGFTSGLANIAPEISLRLLALLHDGQYEQAMAVWAMIRPFEDLRARRVNALNVSAVKEALAQRGMCRRDVRPPISVLDSSERDEVTQMLASWDLG